MSTNKSFIESFSFFLIFCYYFSFKRTKARTVCAQYIAIQFILFISELRYTSLIFLLSLYAKKKFLACHMINFYFPFVLLIIMLVFEKAAFLSFLRLLLESQNYDGKKNFIIFIICRLLVTKKERTKNIATKSITLLTFNSIHSIGIFNSFTTCDVVDGNQVISLSIQNKN